MLVMTKCVGRREFLGCSAAAAMSLLGRRSGAAEGWGVRLSTSSVHFSRLPIEQAVGRIASLGFEAIDIWSGYTGCPHLDDALGRLGPNGVKELLGKHKLRLFAFSVYVGGYRKYAELLGRCGGGVAIRGSSGPVKAGELRASMKAFLESLKPELELANKYDSRLAIENHSSALLDSVDSFKVFGDLNREPRLGIALAPYHLQGIKAPVEQVIRICGKQLFFFYAWQLGEGVGQLPGHGPTDFGPWIGALAEVQYGGYINPFMHGDLGADAMSQALERSRAYLKGIDGNRG